MTEARNTSPGTMIKNITEALRDPDCLPEIRTYTHSIITLLLALARESRTSIKIK